MTYTRCEHVPLPILRESPGGLRHNQRRQGPLQQSCCQCDRNLSKDAFALAFALAKLLFWLDKASPLFCKGRSFPQKPHAVRLRHNCADAEK